MFENIIGFIRQKQAEWKAVRFKTILFIILSSFMLFACSPNMDEDVAGGGNTSTDNGKDNNGNNNNNNGNDNDDGDASTEDPILDEIPRSATVDYASVASVSLSVVDLPEDLKTSQLTVESGQAPGLIIKDQKIRFLTPSDLGKDSLVVLKAQLANESVTVPITIRTQRAFIPFQNAGYKEFENLFQLEVQGLAEGVLSAENDLVFSIKNAPPLDSNLSAAGIYVPSTEKGFNLNWIFDSKTNSFRVPASKIAAILKNIPIGDAKLGVEISSLDKKLDADDISWEMLVYKPTDAVLEVTLVDLKGKPVPEAAGKLVAIRGNGDNPIRKVATVDSNGSFKVNSLLDGSYQLFILDSNNPDFWSSTAVIYADSKKVKVTLTYDINFEKKSSVNTSKTK